MPCTALVPEEKAGQCCTYREGACGDTQADAGPWDTSTLGLWTGTKHSISVKFKCFFTSDIADTCFTVRLIKWKLHSCKNFAPQYSAESLFSGAKRWTATLHGAVSRREPCPAIATSWGLAAMTRSPTGWRHGRGPERSHRSRSGSAGLSKDSCSQSQREAIPQFTKCCACPAE